MRKYLLINLLLILFSVFVNAQAQSFFIAPGQTIEGGNIIRGFCLEYTKDVLSNQNIGDLRRASGKVLVTFTDGRIEEMTFEDIYLNRRLLQIRGFESAQYIQIFFDNSINKVVVTDPDGIVLFKENMSEADSTLIRENARIIAEMLRNGASHQAAQNAAWLNKTPTYRFNEQTNTMTFDFHTSPEGRQLTGKYGRTATVLFDHYSGEYRFDGLQANTSNQTRAIYDFLTHFHSDHVDYRTLEKILDDGLKSSVYFPLPMRDSSLRKQSFQTMWSIANTGNYEFDIQYSVCELLPSGTESVTPIIHGFIGQFFYTRYQFGELTIDTYRHINPKNENADGLIYRIQYHGVSQLILGDFDDEEALADLLHCTEENREKQIEVLEEIYVLEGQLLLGALSQDDYVRRRNELQERRQRYPIITADIVKWPHHAHLFKNPDLAEQLNKIVNPHYFIYQVHSAQDLQAFKAFIDGTTFPEKFINSGEYDVEIISLLELLNVLRQG